MGGCVPGTRTLPKHLARWIPSTTWQRVDTVAGTHADRDLLFEALAIHLGFVGRDALEEARRARPDDADPDAGSAPALAEILVARERPGRRSPRGAGHAGGRPPGEARRGREGLPGRPERLRPAPPRAGAEAGPGGKLAPDPPLDPHRRHGSPGPRSRPGRGRRGPTGIGPRRLGPRPAADDDDDDDEDEERADYEWSLAAPGALGNRFQIMHAHARGGIGVVSVAFDAELQREVALKQIKSESADDPDSRARFLLEAEVTGRLEHPGIVPVYGLGFDDQGRPYYAMRFVRGITLDEAIAKFHQGRRRRRPRPEGARRWSCGSCWAGS